MNNFYTELKTLRESQNIDLEEINSRTKINIEYLEAIESGQFEILPVPYIRLFLRAYVTEIGGDSNEALHQLEIYLAKKEGRRFPKRSEQKSPQGNNEDNETASPKPSLERSASKIRQDLIKGGLLLVVFLFAIYIIKKINQEHSAAVMDNGKIILTENPDAISNDQLINDYVELVSQTDAMSVEPPYKLKLAANERIWYRIAVDTSASQQGILSPGEERSIAFEDEIHVRLNQSAGTVIYINGQKVKQLGEFNHPAEITFLSAPRTVTVNHYLPQR